MEGLSINLILVVLKIDPKRGVCSICSLTKSLKHLSRLYRMLQVIVEKWWHSTYGRVFLLNLGLRFDLVNVFLVVIGFWLLIRALSWLARACIWAVMCGVRIWALGNQSGKATWDSRELLRSWCKRLSVSALAPLPVWLWSTQCAGALAISAPMAGHLPIRICKQQNDKIPLWVSPEYLYIDCFLNNLL